MNNKSKAKKLDFTGVETFTTDLYYDIVNGYYTKEIKCAHTREQLQKAIEVIESLADHLNENELVG